jgi:outer membrane protein insertion porin family
MGAAALLAAALLSGPAFPEGRTISQVTVEAEGLDESALRALIELKPGELATRERVRHAVELLFATGRFQDVVVEEATTAEGVALTFRPQPAPLLGNVAVEGDRVLDVEEVRRLSRLRDGEPLWPARLERAARDVALALTQDGWLEAQVQAVPRGEAKSSTAVFTVQKGTRVRVSEAVVEGAPSHLTVLLRDKARPRPGRPFRRAEVTKAAESMRELLVRRGYGRARVEPRESYDPSVARMRLAFTVDAGPALTLELRGDPLPEARLRSRLEQLIREGGAGSDALEEGRDLLERALLDRGHREAAVSYRTEPRPRGEAIVYDVKTGPAAIVGSLRVSADEETGLEAPLLTRPETPLRDRVVEEDVRTLTRTLEDRGYPEAKVDAETPDGGGRVPVVFRVREGPRVTVSSVHIDSPVPLPAGQQPRELRMRSGVPYRVRDLARDRMSVLSAYRDGGYPDAEVVPAVVRSADGREAQVTLKVVPGERVDVDHLVVAGLDHTREAVVRRELTLKEGEPLGLDRLLESQRRLAALGIFERVSVAEIDPESREQRSLRVSVEEAPRTTVAYGIGSAEGDLLRGSVEVTRRNLFGMDRSLSTFARVSFKGSRFLITYREPFLFGRRQEMFVTAFREEEDRPYFDYERHGGFVQAGRLLRPDWNLILRYTYQQTRAFNIVSNEQVGREFAYSTFSGPAAVIVNEMRDDPLDPRRGHFLSADLQLSARALGGNSFLKGFMQASSYQRLNARTVLAVSGRLGLARTFGLEESIFLPRPDRFYAGGDYSLRGFDTDAVEPQGGNALLLGNAELRIDVGRSFSTALFGDVGNVYELVSDVDLGDLRASAGVGLRYRTAFGPVRVDWAFKLNPRDDESRSRVHLTIGHAF